MLLDAWLQATAEQFVSSGIVAAGESAPKIVGTPSGVRATGRPVAGVLLVSVVVGCSSTTTRPRPVPTTPRPSGEAGKPAATIIADARKALLGATSVHVTGTFTISSAGAPDSTQQLDLRLTRIKAEPAAAGTVTTITGTGAKASTVTLALIRLANTLYIRGDRAYYARIGPKAAAVAGRWLSLPTAQDRSVADLTDVSSIAAGLSASSEARVRGVVQLGGASVVQVMAGTDATLYVAAAGAARPVRLRRSMSGSTGVSGTLDFSDYDAPVSVAAPAGAVAIAKCAAEIAGQCEWRSRFISRLIRSSSRSSRP